jgi:putative heme-binding domain-containing protein
VAWYDDLELVRVGSVNLPGAVGKVLGAVTRHYAARGPVESIVPTLLALKQSDPRLATVVLDAFAAGWPQGSSPQISQEQLDQLRAVLKAQPAETQERMLILARRWGQQELFEDELAAAKKALLATVNARRTEPAQRVDAAKRLLTLDDSLASVQAVLKQIAPTALPQVQADLLESVSTSSLERTGAEIVKRWGAMTPATQRSALGVLMRRPSWTQALLNGIESGAVNVKDLRAEHWQALTRNRDRSIAQRARQLEQSTGRAPNPDKQKVIESLTPQLAEAGDAARGKQVYVQNCAVCHTIEGEGGKVGPDLTGIGARTRNDLIVEIIDPNRSVEGTYRQWTVETKTEILYGRLMSESNTSIEVIDAAGKIYAIPRSEVISLVASDMSVMPEGFEGVMKPQEINDLLEYLATSKVKH